MKRIRVVAVVPFDHIGEVLSLLTIADTLSMSAIEPATRKVEDHKPAAPRVVKAKRKPLTRAARKAISVRMVAYHAAKRKAGK